MKKIIIGALVGGILLFLWQFLSWTVLQLHASGEQYTPKQDAVLQALSSQLTESGQYLLPGVPPDATSAQREAAMNSMAGKPWAIVSYHTAYDASMGSNILHVLVVNIILAGLLCWLLLQLRTLSFGKIFTAALVTGIIIFLNVPYTDHIWFLTPGMGAYLADALVSWGLVGLWLGWWLPRQSGLGRSV